MSISASNTIVSLYCSCFPLGACIGSFAAGKLLNKNKTDRHAQDISAGKLLNKNKTYRHAQDISAGKLLNRNKTYRHA